MYKFGTIVLIPFPFTDLSSTKLRPVLIISPTNKEEFVTVSFITSKKPLKLNKSHYELSENDKDFKFAGLKTNSYIRFDKIATLSKKLILGELGHINPATLKKIKKSFEAAFGF